MLRPALQKLAQFWGGVFAPATVEAVQRQLLAVPAARPAVPVEPQLRRDPRSAVSGLSLASQTMPPVVAGPSTRSPAHYSLVPAAPSAGPATGRSPAYAPGAPAFAPHPAPANYGPVPLAYHPAGPSPHEVPLRAAYQPAAPSPGHHYAGLQPLPQQQLYPAAPGNFAPASPTPAYLNGGAVGPAAYGMGHAGPASNSWGSVGPASHVPIVVSQAPPPAAAGNTGPLALPDFLFSLMDAGLIHMPGSAPQPPPKAVQPVALVLPLTRVDRSKLEFQPSRVKVSAHI